MNKAQKKYIKNILKVLGVILFIIVIAVVPFIPFYVVPLTLATVSLCCFIKALWEGYKLAGTMPDKED